MKMKLFNGSQFVLLGLFACLFSGLNSQQASSESVYYKNFNGEWNPIDVEDWPQYQNKKNYNKGRVIHKGPGGLSVTINYVDVINGTGVGFDDPTDGLTRRSTVSSVMSYIDGVLNESGSVEIEFATSVIFPASGTLASAGTVYKSLPAARFDTGEAFIRITTNVDAFPSSPEINSTVNFGRNWNSDLGAPAGGEFDLFSVILHEVTHGLGMASLVSASGTSRINGTNPGIFTEWDNQLERSSDGFNLFSGSGTYNGTPADLLNSNIEFNGANAAASFGSNPPIFAPASFSSGSSISHFDSGTGAVMESTISPGVSNRTYTDFELGALKDLGYANVVTPVENWREY